MHKKTARAFERGLGHMYELPLPVYNLAMALGLVDRLDTDTRYMCLLKGRKDYYENYAYYRKKGNYLLRDLVTAERSGDREYKGYVEVKAVVPDFSRMIEIVRGREVLDTRRNLRTKLEIGLPTKQTSLFSERLTDNERDLIYHFNSYLDKANRMMWQHHYWGYMYTDYIFDFVLPDTRLKIMEALGHIKSVTEAHKNATPTLGFRDEEISNKTFMSIGIHKSQSEIAKTRENKRLDQIGENIAGSIKLLGREARIAGGTYEDAIEKDIKSIEEADSRDKLDHRDRTVSLNKNGNALPNENAHIIDRILKGSEIVDPNEYRTKAIAGFPEDSNYADTANDKWEPWEVEVAYLEGLEYIDQFYDRLITETTNYPTITDKIRSEVDEYVSLKFKTRIAWKQHFGEMSLMTGKNERIETCTRRYSEDFILMKKEEFEQEDIMNSEGDSEYDLNTD